MHVLAWAHMAGNDAPQRRDELLQRVRLWMGHYPYFFAADGAYTEFGRSLAYKFARLGAPLWAYKLGVWPHPVGMLKRLVGRHLRWYVNRGAIRPDGTLRQSLTASGSPEVIERYISSGATYWAMQAFSGLWSLPDDDPFWTAEEEPLPAEQSDYVKVFPQPGWVVTATNGHVQRFNGGSVKSGYGAKYSKLVYSAAFPFNVGLDGGSPGIDGCLCLTEAGMRGQRETNLAYAVGESGWLRLRYEIQVNGHRHRIETIIIPLGAVHLRAHRITLDSSAQTVSAEEGSVPLGYDAGAVPTVSTQAGWLFAAVGGRAVGMKPLLGYTDARVVAGSPNSVYGYNLVSALTAVLNRQHDLVCLAYAGALPDLARLPLVDHAGWGLDEGFTVRVNGEVVTVPPLPAG